MQTLTLTIIPILLILSILDIVVGCCLLNSNWRAALPKYSLPMNFETKSDISKHFDTKMVELKIYRNNVTMRSRHS